MKTNARKTIQGRFMRKEGWRPRKLSNDDAPIEQFWNAEEAKKPTTIKLLPPNPMNWKLSLEEQV